MNRWFTTMALLMMFGATAEARPVRGPYIQQTTPSSAVIVWRTEAASTSQLYYGRSPDALTEEVTVDEQVIQHEIPITGLEPDTTYYYAVGPKEAPLAGPNEDHHFVTAPRVSDATPFTFWVVGDSGVATAKQARVRDAMLRENGGEAPDVYLHVGDMAYSTGTDEEFQDRFFAMYANVLRNTASFPAIGNHENGSSDSLVGTGPYYDAYVLPTRAEAGGLASGTEAYYSWDWANVHFVVLESYREELRATDGPMLEWLEMDLASTDQDWLVVYFHHPPYTKGSHDSDVEIAHIEIRERVMPLIEAAGVDLVLGGHSHIYERSHLVHGAYDTPTTAAGHIVDPGDGRGNRPYEKLGAGALDGNVCIVAGHGGTNTGRDGDEEHPLMVMSELANGSVIVSVDGDLMRVKNVRLDGVVSDAFSITKGHAVALTAPDPDIAIVAGSTTAITWVSSGAIETVRLDYLADEDWVTIAEVPAGPGSFVWTIPDLAGEAIGLRITDVGGSGADDELDRRVPVIGAPPVQLIAFESRWRYHVEALDGEDWTAPGFRDTPWERGQGAFAACACLPWECACNAYLLEALLVPTLYLRKDFVVEEELAALDLSMIHEVGAKVWINGTEVYARHIDDESFDAFADPEPLAAELVRVRIDLEEHPVLVEGENTIAVMVKKSETLGANLYFDLALDGVRPEPGGCGCHTAHRRRALPWAFLALLPILLARRRR